MLAVWDEKYVSWSTMGFGRAIEVGALAVQAKKGDNTMDEPSRIIVPAHMFWSAWENNRGMSQDLACQLLIEVTVTEHTKYGMA